MNDNYNDDDLVPPLLSYGTLLPYRPKRVDYEKELLYFKAWATTAGTATAAAAASSVVGGHGRTMEEYVVQLRINTNFQTDHVTTYYYTNDGGMTFVKYDNNNNNNNDLAGSSSSRMVSLNSFKNYKTSNATSLNKFIEMNMYKLVHQQQQQQHGQSLLLSSSSSSSQRLLRSNHHTSTKKGLHYTRDTSDDLDIVETKGKHWKY